MIYGISTRLIAMVVGGVLVLALVLGGLSYCQKQRSAASQARMERSQADAAANSAADAIGSVARSGEAAAESENLTRSNDQEIRNAQGANDAVNPAVNAAGLRSLCRRAAYRDHERCKLLNAPAR